MKISFCTTCKGRTHHLRQTLLPNLRQNVDWHRPDDAEFIVLDYSSDDGLIDWITTDPRLRPYREAGILKVASAPGQEHFRHSHAKNMAHFLATGDYVCNLDADNFTGPGFAQYLRSIFTVWPWAIVATDRLDKRLNAGLYKGSMGRVALSYGSFAMLGGYDESDRFRGWAGEDSDLVIRAVRYRMRPVFIRQRKFLRVVLHSDLERIVHTEHSDASAELAKISALDGTQMAPILRYVLNRAVAPRVANRGALAGAGEIVWHDVTTQPWEVEAVG